MSGWGGGPHRHSRVSGNPAAVGPQRAGLFSTVGIPAYAGRTVGRPPPATVGIPAYAGRTVGRPPPATVGIPAYAGRAVEGKNPVYPVYPCLNPPRRRRLDLAVAGSGEGCAPALGVSQAAEFLQQRLAVSYPAGYCI